jgi:methylthioribose-1-phosphate isomerase
MIDQRKLPCEYVEVEFTDYREVARAIREMYIRGAPAIGTAAAYGVALAAVHSQARTISELRADVLEAVEVLRATRPTASNLFWALNRMLTGSRTPARGLTRYAGRWSLRRRPSRTRTSKGTGVWASTGQRW